MSYFQYSRKNNLSYKSQTYIIISHILAYSTQKIDLHTYSLKQTAVLQVSIRRYS